MSQPNDLKKASDRMEHELEGARKPYLLLSLIILLFIDFAVIFGATFLTEDLLTIVLISIFIFCISLISLVPAIKDKYDRTGRKPPFLIRIFNGFLEKMFPVNRTALRIGSKILLNFIFLITIGGFIAICSITFADVLTGNDQVYNYLIQGAPPGEYGFYSFIQDSTANSLVPTILWNIIIFIPVIFCFLLLLAAVYYRNNDPSKTLSILTAFSPLLVLLPLFLTASSITSPSIIISLIFLAAWGITLLIWLRPFTKRNAFMALSVFFAQVLASFLLFYGFIFNVARFVISGEIDISPYYNPLFLLLWFGLLVSIPLIVKAFDKLGKLQILGIALVIAISFIFQFLYVFPLFRQSIYVEYPGNPQLAEIYVGFGFFYFYFILLLIPLFFIFGYFQIGLVRWIYRTLRDHGIKTKRPEIFRLVGIVLASLVLVGLVIVYYIILYEPNDYLNMFKQFASLFNGEFIYFLTNTSAVAIDPTAWKEVFEVGSLAITVGLLAYSSYRGAYNLALFSDQIEDPEKQFKRLGLFNFIVFTSPRSYKTRLLFGIGLIFVFLGIISMFAFLKIHTYLFFTYFNIIPNPSLIIFSTMDGIKLGISLLGIIIAIALFFYFISKKSRG